MEIGAEAQISERGMSEIRALAREFFEEFWSNGEIEDACDRMGVGVIFVSGLISGLGMESYATYDFKNIVIDEKFAGDDEKLEFLIAHELGHILMHKDYFPSNIGGLEDYLGYVSKYINTTAEMQADIFAEELLRMRDFDDRTDDFKIIGANDDVEK